MIACSNGQIPDADPCARYRELIRAREEVRDAVHAYRREPTHSTQERLLRALLLFTARLEQQFAGEESELMGPLVERRPTAATDVDRLCEQHRQIGRTARRLIDDLRERLPDAGEIDALHRNLCALLDRLREHERSEHGLILDAFWLDTGAGD